jgi:hypothetical protein
MNLTCSRLIAGCSDRTSAPPRSACLAARGGAVQPEMHFL